MKKIFSKIKQKIRNNLPHIIVAGLMVTLLLIYLFPNIFIFIHSGEAGVLYRRFYGGTVVDKVYGEGLKIIWPFDIMYIYNVRIQEVTREFKVLTKNGLKVGTLISIRYYPGYDQLGVLHQRLGPNYLEKIIIPEIEAVLRIIIGRLEAEEVYRTETSLIEKSVNEAVEEVAQRFVNIDDVLIKQITLPVDIEKAIQYKMEQKHVAEAHIFKIQKEKREAERKRIEGRGIRDQLKIIAASLPKDRILKWFGIKTTLELAQSQNAKVVIIGGKDGLPIIGNVPFMPEESAANNVEVEGEVPAVRESMVEGLVNETANLP
ncbi:MAG: prohibitin family protein [Desulfobacteraceae bacterium]|nr:prohibitin family protein [Desulfobacteraceae bacterium]